jgi:hypothetical protein
MLKIKNNIIQQEKLFKYSNELSRADFDVLEIGSADLMKRLAPGLGMVILTDVVLDPIAIDCGKL